MAFSGAFLTLSRFPKSLAGGLGALLTRMSARSELQPEAIGRDPAEAEPSAPADDMGAFRQSLDSQNESWRSLHERVQGSLFRVVLLWNVEQGDNHGCLERAV